MLELFIKGGPLMWPLLLASVCALSVAIERLWFAASQSLSRNRADVAQMLSDLEQGKTEEAVRVGDASKDFVARVLGIALKHPAAFPEAMLAAASAELNRYHRGLAVLDTVITLAPLLGLLGTVTGMISSFSLLGGAELGAPAAITGGIAEALIATAFGLGVAITALIPFNFLNARQESARAELQEAASRAELLLKK